MGERVRVVRHDGRLLAAKEPGPQGAAALITEAEVLRRVQIPGVVELVGRRDGDHPALLTRWVGPRSLADIPLPIPPERAAALCLAVAATVGRLHRAGVVHTAIEPAHVLLDGDGRPVLCGFGRAGPISTHVHRPAPDQPGPHDADEAPPPSRRPATDVAGLGHLLSHLLGDGESADARGRWSRSGRSAAARRRALLMVSAQATVPDPSGRPSVTAFAHAVRRAVPDAHLDDDTPVPRPGTAPRTSTGRHARSAPRPTAATDPDGAKGMRATIPAVAALVAIGATTYFGLSAWWSPSPARTAVATPVVRPATTTPDTAARPTSATTSTASGATTSTTSAPVIPATPVTAEPAIVEHDGRRFEVGAGGDVVLVGPWLCDGQDLAVVLHPDDGTVHLFTGWAPQSGTLTAHVVATVSHATGLDHVADGPGCADLTVTGAGRVLATLTAEDLR